MALFRRLPVAAPIVLVALLGLWVASQPASRSGAQGGHAGGGPVAAAGNKGRPAAGAARRPGAPVGVSPTVRGTVAGPAEPDAFAAFDGWLMRFHVARATTGGEVSASLVAEGEQLAMARYPDMLALIEADPRQALQQSATWADRAALPEAVADWVEQPFSGLGDLSVVPVCDGHPDGQGQRRFVDWGNGEGWTANVFDQRMSQPTKAGTPMQGVVLGTQAALHPAPMEILHPEDVAAVLPRFPLANPDPARDFATGDPLGVGAVTVLGGGRLFRFRDEPSASEFIARVGALDQLTVAGTGSAIVFQALDQADGRDLPARWSAKIPAGLLGPDGFDLPLAEQTVEDASSEWTTGRKNVLVIQVDFADKPGAPVDAATLARILADRPASGVLEAMSYGKLSLVPTIPSRVYRMPQSAAAYRTTDSTGTSRNSDLHAAARAAAATDGYDVDAGYDMVLVVFAQIGMKHLSVVYSAIAEVGGPCLMAQGTMATETLVHEFGHTLGLGHASSWDPATANPVGAGSSAEYGDIFDIMGEGPVPAGHFNVQAKQMLGWLPAADWADATARGSGLYRLQRFDAADATGQRAVRITKGSGEYYWIGYRQNFPANPSLLTGVNLLWQKPGQSRCWLVDTRPLSPAGKEDAGLAMGRTYSDAAAGIHLTPVARGGDSPNEWIDVRVNLGTFPGNRAPTASLYGPTALTARHYARFTVTATDPDGDALACWWDFGDGSVKPDCNSVAHAYRLGGRYTVAVVVSDGKGQTVSKTMAVTVADPLQTWATVASGTTVDLKSICAGPGELLAVGNEGRYAKSTNGSTWTTGRATGANNFWFNKVAWTGALYVGVGVDYDPELGVWVAAVATSADGTTWTRRYAGAAGGELMDVACGNGRLVAVGLGGVVVTSTDGLAWSPAASGTFFDLTGLACANGWFSVVGQAAFYGNPVDTTPVILRSHDGLAWEVLDPATHTYLPADACFEGVDAANDRFLASGWYANIGYSLDATAWRTTMAVPYCDDVEGFAFGNGVYYGVGSRLDPNADGSPAPAAARDYLSTDGVAWTSGSPGEVNERAGIVFFQDRFYTVGAGGQIRQSGVVAAELSFYSWQEEWFPGLPQGSGPAEDWDHDGLVNAMEYALGCDARSASGPDGRARLPQAALSSDPLLSGRLALRVDLPEPARGDVAYSVEVADGLSSPWETLATKTGAGPWTWVAGGTPRIVTGPVADGRVPVWVGDSQPLSAAAHRFLRLRTVVQAP